MTDLILRIAVVVGVVLLVIAVHKLRKAVLKASARLDADIASVLGSQKDGAE